MVKCPEGEVKILFVLAFVQKSSVHLSSLPAIPLFECGSLFLPSIYELALQLLLLMLLPSSVYVSRQDDVKYLYLCELFFGDECNSFLLQSYINYANKTQPFSYIYLILCAL